MEMEILYDQIEDAAEFAANANQPYSPAQIERIAYNLGFHTGFFDSPCRKWKDKHAADCTQVYLKFHFSLAHKIIRESKSRQRQQRNW